jgi:hypothetical protein
MQRVTVIYPNKTDAKFDFDYYMKKHIPFVARADREPHRGSPRDIVCDRIVCAVRLHCDNPRRFRRGIPDGLCEAWCRDSRRRSEVHQHRTDRAVRRNFVVGSRLVK